MRLLLGLAALALLYLGLVYLGQRRVTFPAHLALTPPVHGPAERVSLALPAGPVEAFLILPARPNPGPFPLLLFAHGNAETADGWIDDFQPVRAWGWGALLVEYPGYGRSAGKPSERSIREAMLAAYDWAREDGRIDPARIVGYGRSLGGGAIGLLAAERPLAGLILESTFTSVRPLAARFLVPALLLRDPFDNVRALARYRGPLLVLHGIHDEVVPIGQARALAVALPGAELHELPCGHNDCPLQWELIERFLRDHALR